MKAHRLDVPEGFEIEELTVNDDFSISGDTVKQAARLRVESDKNSRREKIKGVKAVNSVAELREIVAAIAEEIGIDTE